MDQGAGIGAGTWPPSPIPPSSRYSPQPEQVSPADPFSGTARPVLPTNNISNVNCNSGVVATGVAYRNLTIRGACQVANGTLVVAQRLRVNAGASLTGTNATLYFSCRRSGPNRAQNCDAGGSSSTLQVRGGGSLRLTGGSLSAGARPLAIYFDPDNGDNMTVAGTLDIGAASVYKRLGSLSIDGAMTVGGLISAQDLTVAAGDTLDVTTTGLGVAAGSLPAGPGAVTLLVS